MPEGAPARQPRSGRRAALISIAALAMVGCIALTTLSARAEDPTGMDTLAAWKAQESARPTMLVSENDAANPSGGVLENVPATVVAPVPGPPDFNGASAVVARLPNIGFAPSLLTEKGFETRGSFTVRKSRAGESFYLRVYGKLNHNIRCTLRGYRNLSGDFTGNTIYTGFKKIYNGKSQVQTGHVPRGIVGEFDIMTCRDLGNGEVQYFRIRYS
uniref:Uncharacterized protein n=1 Tax=Hemiselmis andersenii TaxID=464988 RepID=A0A7S1DH51_HEMAN